MTYTYSFTCHFLSSDYAVLAIANLLPVSVIMILIFSPIYPPLTNITNPLILAMPSPCLPICVMSTSYSLPTWGCIAPAELLLKLLVLLFVLYDCLFPKLVRGGGGLSFSCPGCNLI